MKFSVNTLLTFILILLTAAIFVLTAAFFVVGKGFPPKITEPAKTAAESTQMQSSAYSGFGRLRAVTRPDELSSAASVVFTPWFAYQNEDSAFYEELSQKSGILKKAMIQYFEAHTLSELHSLGEEQVKTELTAVINEKLVLDKIDSLYFSEYAILE
ncbi:MAG: flagellar basal body-associated FliL family protein [Treponema sp.]